MNLWDFLILPFQFEFMNNALIISALVAVPMALLSCFLVLKGWSLMGDAISHAVFPGVVIAYMIGIPLAIGAFVAGMFGLGLVLYVKIQSDVHLDHILFGDMLGVSMADIIQALVIALVVAAVIGIKWKDFLLHAFDPGQARAVGLRVNLLHYGLLAMISLTIVGALQAVGIILSIAMLIAPGAIAFLLTRRFSTMLMLATVIALVGSLLGVYLSFFMDSAPAPTIVLLLTIVFICAFIYSTGKAARVESSEMA